MGCLKASLPFPYFLAAFMVEVNNGWRKPYF
ncbi:hypothetical protein EHW99_1538 [Erwinia amylovora]|uniref:Uncharacterized protein n=2 Tax=Erwinia amylovora TaxID=552 RepID=A0A831ESQ6_ERWAM|nr:hypothetical protein EaACW_2061 [Erwinia amylovora ACW56400]QJQ54242.1 hypothetical protein EHX00_1538 [Erwinia amylovora]CBA20999.1 hypothetical protein predicted by Glimmer/Critica [Erwinia amylovora CFBP1430]CCO78906.1 hypothetical protein BN432_2111 [Erwinia amylovora Ea356]CCO82704.1 hypothetical protein BN433_2136 [Erwinia amylovora Ea266]CCO86485.1 hypothetical protein BN434_2099 [Erwinia amylovora CFBP 2585]CCO90271.1 hypothetical protein BN435_2103 [Erwinia amylovora 01SFR-BO]CCO